MTTLAPTDSLDFDGLWRAYHHRLRGFIRLRVRDLTDADDIAAEVFARAIDAARRGKGPHANALAWLFQIARRLCIDYWRKRAAMPTVDIDAAEREDEDGYAPRAVAETIVSCDPSPHELAEQAIVCQQVQHAIGRLCGEQPVVVRMRLDGYEYGEIAMMLGKRDGAVKQLNIRAMAGLREYLRGAEV